MKKILGFMGFAVLLTAFIAAGNVAGFAQDVCTEEAKTALDAKFRELLPKKELADRKATVDAGKQYLEKYGNCEDSKDFVEYLKKNIPIMEQRIKDMEEAERFGKLLAKFNDGLKSSNWDDVYTAGKQILAEKPDEFRDAELVLGSIGLDETAKTPSVTKWNEDTLRYARQSIADLEAGKTFKTFGVGRFQYKNKDDAIGWMNYTIGYIYYFDKKDKKTGVSYIYKASQLGSTKTTPQVFQAIGAYYYEDVVRLASEVKTLIDSQKPDDTPEVAQQKVDAIKAKIGMVNGTTERALDAYAQAYRLVDPADKSKAAYRESLHKSLQDLYAGRFAKPDGFEAWLKGYASKPLPDPLSTITPVNDPDPVAPVTTPGTSPGTKPPVNTKPPTAPGKGTEGATSKRPSTSRVLPKQTTAKRKGA